jgi:hypothetical protein
MPYVLPKTESVKHNLGEPDEFKMKRWHDWAVELQVP